MGIRRLHRDLKAMKTVSSLLAIKIRILLTFLRLNRSTKATNQQDNELSICEDFVFLKRLKILDGQWLSS